MVEYREIFLSKMKSLLSYFIKFSNNRFILPKVYLNNYEVKRLDQRSIIVIIYDENILSVNDGCWKV